jgi:hypothetical protein
MPPYLRHGIPVEQRIPPKPQPLHLCTCWQCFAQSAINPITLKVEQGAYVPWSVYRKHLDEDETRGIAPPEISNTVVGPQSCSSRSVPKPHSVQSSPYDRATNLERTVEDIRTRLPAMRSRSINHEQLVFVTPPTSTSLPLVFQGFDTRDTTEVNSGTYALEYSAPENYNLLRWEEWLTESLQHIERGKGSHDVVLRLKSAIAWKEVTDALEEVDNIRAKEWERQRVLLSAGVSDPGSSSRTSTSIPSPSASNLGDQVQKNHPPHLLTYTKWNHSLPFHFFSLQLLIYFANCQLIAVHSSSHAFEKQLWQQRKLRYPQHHLSIPCPYQKQSPPMFAP